MGDIPKQAAGYQCVPNTQYICGDCAAYDPDDRRCLYTGRGDIILPYDGSNYFTKGEPESIVPRNPEMAGDDDCDSAMGLLTLSQIGWARSNFGFTCKRCKNFIEGSMDCRRVDKDSPGDTPGMIHPDACCNIHVMDPARNWPTEAFA